LPWPTPKDYQEAVQHAEHCFHDPQLRAGQPQLDAVGLPRPWCGNFAVVFCLDCGTARWAVRCFQTDRPDQEKRYEAISECLDRVKLPHTVGFEFQSLGIRVGRASYPVVKMEWVDGGSLREYVETYHRDRQRMTALAGRWLELTRALRTAGIAHGDLSDANVRVLNHELKLVDYDGMYVPALAGQSGCERGHRNYQPPWRLVRDFGPELDYLSAWVIFISLYALAVAPDLWDEVNKGGDDCLLFRQADFEAPDTSPAFSATERTGDAALCAMMADLRAILASQSPCVPPVDERFSGELIVTPPSSVSDAWWVSAVRDERDAHAEPSQPAVSETAPLGAGWVLDHLEGLSTPVLERTSAQVSLDRVLLAVTTAIAAVVAWIAPPMDLVYGAVFLSLVVGAVLYVRYRASPGHLAGGKREAIAEVRRWRREMQLLRAELDRLGKQRADLDESERRERDEAVEKHDRLLDGVTAGMHTAESTWAKMRDRLARERTGAHQRCAEAKRAVLAQGTKAHVEAALQAHSVWQMNVHGIGEKRKSSLFSAGIRTAADVSYWRVHGVRGFGDQLAWGVQHWADSIRARAGASAANALPPDVVRAIEERLSAELAQISQREQEARERHDAKTRRLRSEEQRILATAKASQDRIERGYAVERKGINDDVQDTKGKLGGPLWGVARAERELQRYSNVGVLPYLRALFALRRQ